MQKLFSSLFVLFFMITGIQAQKKTYPGYIVTSAGDTISVIFTKTYTDQNPSYIETLSGEVKKKYQINELSGFGIIGYQPYVKHTVTVHTGDVSGPNLPFEFTDDIKTATVFLRILVQGHYSLFEWQASDRTYYFISQGNNFPEELIYRVKQNGNVIVEDRQYINQLNAIIASLKVTKSEIKNTERISYKNKNIVAIVKDINEEYGGAVIWATKRENISISIGAGVFMNLFPSSFTSSNFMDPKQIKLRPGFSPSAGLNITYRLSGKFDWLGAGLSLLYNQYASKYENNKKEDVVVSPNYYYTADIAEKYSINNSAATLDLYGLLYLPLKSRVSVYAKIGMNNIFFFPGKSLKGKYQEYRKGIQNGNVPFTSAVSYNQDIHSLFSVIIQPSVGVGIQTGRHKFQVSWLMPSNASTSVNKEKVFKLASIGAHYFFSLTK